MRNCGEIENKLADVIAYMDAIIISLLNSEEAYNLRPPQVTLVLQSYFLQPDALKMK